MNHHYDIDTVRSAAVGQWPRIFESLAQILGEYLIRSERSCPCCPDGGKTRWRVYDDFDETGGCRCNVCGNWGNGFKFLEWRLNQSFKEVLNLVGEFLNCAPSEQQSSRKRKSKPKKQESVASVVESAGEQDSVPPVLNPDREALRILIKQTEKDKKAAVKAGDENWADYIQILSSLEAKYASLHWLADELGVSVDSLKSLEVKFDKKEDCWLIPEHNALGKVIGTQRRFNDGDKKQKYGGKRGLYFASDWSEKQGPVLIVEGATDTAAGITLGSAVIGRPANKVPKDLLAELVALLKDIPPEHRIILTAENDEKPDGEWPGKEGAIDTAEKLAEALDRPITWGLPQKGVKDLRQWVQANPGKSGGDFVASLICEDAQPKKIRSFQNFTLRVDGNSEILEPIAMSQLEVNFCKVFGRWPQMAYDKLFVPDATSGVRWIDSSSQLQAWMSESLDEPPNFIRRAGFIKEETLFETIKSAADKIDAIEYFPHEPQIAGRYYACESLPEGDLTHLENLLNRFRLASDVDKQLILAFFMTLISGLGKRPAFAITSEGQGCGKTTLAEVGASLVGGLMSFSVGEDIDKLKARLVSKGAFSKRIALIDNAKSRKLSWADLESLITCQEISGRGNFIGEASRPNNMIWVITVNGLAFSRDMAQRSVVIRLKRPQYSATWEESIIAYAAEYRNEILSDLIRMLRSQPVALKCSSRWGGWEGQILSRLVDPEGIQKVILQRQKEIDVDCDDAEVIEDYFREQLNSLRYETDDHVFIPGSIAAKWLYEATGERLTTTKATQDIKTKIESRIIRRLTWKRTGNARGFIWAELWNADANLLHDIEVRIDERIRQDRAEQVRNDQESRDAARQYSSTFSGSR